MNKKFKDAFNFEMNVAKEYYATRHFALCFKRLERAHILGQKYVIPHTLSHWWMLKVGLKTANKREVIGQCIRIVASILFSKLWVPIGNTGGSNVSAMKKMPIPDDLKALLKD
ncbi:DUF3703 domain-containing protein [Pseudoalteromonas luteoviolacea]|uniref:DUF3703 domain-containing protein n=1 Tax=Pseudoalteromonas luteoviolacea DSM 6061 TaxID=1365250 RepID=A0A166Z8G2_9GAMM|nr:DUF3703 domain-containing protein [Pseudoalteromonas luteoviolacea]KZN44050.1 hypothetical protein N475_08050 [Pseudoalteromonas luteoviolacea DSM 6061]MBE0386163.1 hypothetical protein [Pseudoalteromonas luteoviolacea DSM 6061]